MQRWHDGLQQTIRYHCHSRICRPTDDVTAVKKTLTEFGVTYPVVIDTPSVAANGLGLLHDWYGTYVWPFTILIDKQDRVAGYGQSWHGWTNDRDGIMSPFHETWLPSIGPQLKKLTAADRPAKVLDENVPADPVKSK